MYYIMHGATHTTILRPKHIPFIYHTPTHACATYTHTHHDFMTQTRPFIYRIRTNACAPYTNMRAYYISTQQPHTHPRNNHTHTCATTISSPKHTLVMYYIRTHACATYTPTRNHSMTPAITHIHALSLSHFSACSRSYSLSDAHTRAQGERETRREIHTRTRTRTHTHTHTHAHTHTHTYTHTHTHTYIQRGAYSDEERYTTGDLEQVIDRARIHGLCACMCVSLFLSLPFSLPPF